jgi:Fe-S cluster biogenesis protein NfuA
MIENKIRHILERLRPSFQIDGHDIELVEVTDDNIVRISLCGNCNGGCTGSKIIMGLEIERSLKGKLPAIKKVEIVSRAACVEN